MSTSPAEPKRFFPMLKRLTLGILITLLLIAGTKSLEHTPKGKAIEAWAFMHLQGQLSSFDRELPIVVVDMSRIPRGNDGITSRTTLRQTLAAIVTQHPSAVGIDLDFSPDVDGWKLDDDPAFFDFCLKLKHENNVPIFLGVYRTIGAQPNTWLGSDKYKELAAALTADDEIRLPLWLQARDSSEKLPTLGAALAATYHRSLLALAPRLSWPVEVTVDNTRGIELQGEDRMIFGVTLINYSKLEQLERETLNTIRPDSVAESGSKFRGKIVLLGDTKDFTDSFNVPGSNRPKAGVYLLACVAYTLAAHPLYELNPGARLALDLIIAIIFILIVEAVRVRYVKKRAGSRFFKAESWVIGIVMVGVILLGFVMNSWFNVMWLDYPFVLFGLLLHPKIEHHLSRALNKLRRKKTQSNRSTS